MAIQIDINGLKKDIRKYLKTYAETYAKESSRQITIKAKSCIERFYSDYKPIYYDRTFDLLNNSYMPYYKNNGKAFYGGVRVTSDSMSPYYSGGIMSHTYTDPIVIAQLGWHGWHGDPTGYNGRFNPIHTTPPLDMLMDFASNSSFINIIENYAEKNALKQTYKYLQFK